MRTVRCSGRLLGEGGFDHHFQTDPRPSLWEWTMIGGQKNLVNVRIPAILTHLDCLNNQWQGCNERPLEIKLARKLVIAKQKYLNIFTLY